VEYDLFWGAQARHPETPLSFKERGVGRKLVLFLEIFRLKLDSASEKPVTQLGQISDSLSSNP